MKQYLKLGENNVVMGVAISDTPPEAGWVESPTRIPPSSGNFWRLVGNSVQDTGQSKTPPFLGARWNGAQLQWVDGRGQARKASDVRAERDRRLLASDWTQLPDVPLETKEAWAAYRQALRDITDQPGFPETINWPDLPG